MSVYKSKSFYVRYRWCLGAMIPWYRQLIALVFGLGIMLIALWAIEQQTGGLVIASVAGMAFLSLLLIFGIEVDRIQIGNKLEIDFSNTTETRQDNDDE